MNTSLSTSNNYSNVSQILALPEHELQRLVRGICADSARVWHSTNGVSMQILSIGEWNHASGPDFLDVAVFAEGRVHVGNAEFHRSLRDWHTHNHAQNPDFAGLLLHIVLRANNQADTESIARYTLVVSEEELQAAWEQSFKEIHLLSHTEISKTAHPETNATLRDWATRRILRKAHYAESVLNPYKPHETLLCLIDEFLQRNQHKQRRPRGVAQMLALRTDIAEVFAKNTEEDNNLKRFFASIEEGLNGTTRDCAQTIVNKNTLNVNAPAHGKALRQEFFLNILLPLGIALAWHSEKHSEQHLEKHSGKYSGKYSVPNYCAETLWEEFFALRSHSRYAALQRRFPSIDQEYAFVQQGLLEYLAELRPHSSPTQAHISQKTSSELRAEAAHAHAEYVLTLYAAHKQ
ncbi:MAG: DUF2851 family protein [Candidatus Kapaibacterium sp.]|nr:MAG: DUF2851 family protein [Candidatus Kapabacteria bacterium]